jgi:hypothetical protein
MRSQVPPPVTGFEIHGGDNLMSDRELAWEQWREEKQRLLQEEEQKRRDASKLPPFEKTALNWFATAPVRGVLGLLAMSGPGRRQEAEEMMRQLRPLKCTPEEEQGCDAGEQMFDMMATTLVPAAVETAAARQAALTLAREGAWAAEHPTEYAAAERLALRAGLEEGAVATEQSGPYFTPLLERLPPRLNPANYECVGLGCNFGNIRFKPRPVTGSSKVTQVAEPIIEHDAPIIAPAAEEVEASGTGSLRERPAEPDIVAANGTNITNFTGHAVDRAIGDGLKRAGVGPQAILDALKNPLKIGDVRVDQLGRQSQRFIGREAEVVVNPQTGSIVSVNPTSSSKAARLGGGGKRSCISSSLQKNLCIFLERTFSMSVS